MRMSWTETHYKLDFNDWLYIAKHEQEKTVSLVCPGYGRDGQGFSIHFSSAQIGLLEQLIQTLRQMETNMEAAPEVVTNEEESRVPVFASKLTYPVGREL